MDNPWIWLTGLKKWAKKASWKMMTGNGIIDVNNSSSCCFVLYLSYVYLLNIHSESKTIKCVFYELSTWNKPYKLKLVFFSCFRVETLCIWLVITVQLVFPTGGLRVLIVYVLIDYSSSFVWSFVIIIILCWFNLVKLLRAVVWDTSIRFFTNPN